MSDLTNYLENKIIDHLLRATAWAMPSGGIFVGLMTSPSGEAGPGTEPSGGNYGRVQVGPSTTAWTATQGGTSGASSGVNGISANVNDVLFGIPSANWGTITHFGLFDAVTGGNLLMQKALITPKVVNNGDAAPKFLAGALTVTFD